MSQSFPTLFSVPVEPLRPYIERFWGWEYSSQQPVALPPLMPGTGLELFCHTNRPFAVEGRQLPASHIVCVRTRSFSLQATDLRFIAVRFRAGAFRYFSPYPLAEYYDSFTDATDIWGERWQPVMDALRASENWTEKVRLLESFLLSCLARYRKPDTLLDQAIQRLYYQSDSVQVAGLARELGISRFQLVRRFQAAVGCPPKVFQRTARFQRTLKQWLLQPMEHYLDVALQHGYYDQAHFIHELRHYTGEAPRAFYRKNKEAHFYNTSLAQSSMFASN